MNNEEMTFSFEVNDEAIEYLKKLTTIKESNKYTIRTNCSNGEVLEFDGCFKADMSKLFKRKRIGKKYKWFKTKSISLFDFTFQADEVRKVRV